jgi:hypothetical protein
MKIQGILKIAKKIGANAEKMNKADLVRAIRVAQGKNICFVPSRAGCKYELVKYT